MIDINFLSQMNLIKRRKIKDYFSYTIGIILFLMVIYTIYSTQEETPSEKTSSNTLCKNQNCFLTQTPLSELTLVGNIIGDADKWAFIATPDGSIMKIKHNDRIGSQQSQVIEIQSAYIKLENMKEHNYTILPLKDKP